MSAGDLSYGCSQHAKAMREAMEKQRADEIARADAEIAAALKEARASLGSSAVLTTARLEAAIKSRDALDVPPKPRLRTPEEWFEWWRAYGQLPARDAVKEIVEETRREIAKLVQARLTPGMGMMVSAMPSGTMMVSSDDVREARDAVIAALEGKP